MGYKPKKHSTFAWHCWGSKVDRSKFCCVSSSILTVIGVILFIVLLAVSIKDIDDDRLGVPYGKVSRTLGQVQEAGKRAYPPDTKIFMFDRKQVDNTLELDCITMDGLVVDMTVVAQYRFLKNELRTVVLDYGNQEAVDSYVDIIAQDAVRDVCARFNGAQMFSERGIVEQLVVQNVTQAINQADAHVEAGFVQLKNIALPKDLLAAIKAVQISAEDSGVAITERNQALTTARTAKAQAESAAQIKMVQSQAEADSVLIDAQNKAGARAIVWTERTGQMIIDASALGFSAEDYMNGYLLPRLSQRISRMTLTPSQRGCLQTCTGNSCWWCFGQVPVRVAV